MNRASEHTPPPPSRGRDGERGNREYLRDDRGAANLNATRFVIGFIAIVLILACGTVHALKSDAEQPINVRARSVDVNEKTGVSVYRGDVVMTQGSLRLEADRVEITQRQGRTDLIRAWGKPARMRSRTDAGEEIRARAARAEYRAGERRIDLYGDVELRRGADILTGAAVHYRLDQETFTAQGGEGGQVSAVIQPAKPETAR